MRATTSTKTIDVIKVDLTIPPGTLPRPDEMPDLIYCVASGNDEGLAQHRAVVPTRSRNRAWHAAQTRAADRLAEAEARWRRVWASPEDWTLEAQTAAAKERADALTAQEMLRWSPPTGSSMDAAYDVLKSGMADRTYRCSVFAHLALLLDLLPADLDPQIRRRFEYTAAPAANSRRAAALAAKSLQPGGASDANAVRANTARQHLARYKADVEAMASLLGIDPPALDIED